MLRGRTLRELSDRLTEPAGVLDAEELSDRIRGAGGVPIAEVARGDLVSLTGRVRTVLLGGGEGFLGVTAEVFDGTGAVEVCWLGRRLVPGIDTGRFVRVTGRVGFRDGRKIMFNPRYELLAGQPRRTGGESRDRA